MRGVFALMMLLATLPAAAGPGFGPFAMPGHPVTREVARPPPRPRNEGEGGLFLRLSYDFYRAFISPVNGSQCAHRPTCSRYGLLAVDRHGAVGLLLTYDRLIRGPQSSGVRVMRILITDDHLLYLDPLEESTFWFTSSP